MNRFDALVIVLWSFVATHALAEETLIDSVNLPGASLSQEVTYHPTKKEYEEARNAILKRLQSGDKTAMVNSTSGPWMRVETTATIGLEYKGIDVGSGKKNVRQISAAEEALYQFEKSQQ